jgi:phosphoglycerate dehydrogenase-like enzyme
MTTAAERIRPVVAVLYREALPPLLPEIEEISEVRLTTADGLAEALDGAEVLAAMSPTARLINVGRGELVDTKALTEALVSGSIAGAALDVVHPEPLPGGHVLWGMDNVIITAHLSGDTEDYLEDLGQLFVDNLRRFCHGEPLENVVDKALGFVPAS